MNEGKLLWHLYKIFYEELEVEQLSNPYLNPADFSIAGGAIRALITGEKVKDYDIFCASKESEEALIKHLSANYESLTITSRLANFTVKEKWFQVIRGKYFPFGGSKVLIENFDYSICQAMVWYNHYSRKNSNEVKSTNLQLEVGEFFFEDCLSKHLRINRIEYPVNTLERMQKYVKKGYTACRGTILEIYKSIKSHNTDQPPSLSNMQTFYGLD